MENNAISKEEPPKKDISVKGKKMAYAETGAGDPIVFLHGNPTSSYLWRNIMPHLRVQGRCVAPDLIGMGDSDKLDVSGPDRYRLAEHQTYMDGFLDAMGIREDVTLVVHDWGSALGFDWARRHPGAIKGIAYMEAIVLPQSWEDFQEDFRSIFQALRSPAGEKMVLEDNFFVEKILPGAILRRLSDDEMKVYRRPFLNPGEDRRPTLTWPRQIPIEGEPEDVVEIVEDYAAWMEQNDLPKLFINAEPGALIQGRSREFCRTWKNQHELTVEGIHFIQEDHPHVIGKAISEWLTGI